MNTSKAMSGPIESSFAHFLDKARETNKLIEDLRGQCRLAEGLRNKSASVSLGSEQEKIVQQMEDLTANFKTVLAETKKKIEGIQTEHRARRETLQDGPETRAATIVMHVQSLSRRLSNVVNDFRTMQVSFSKIEKERLRAQYLIANPHATEDELDDLESGERGRGLLRSAFTLGDASSKKIIEEAEKRHHSIQHILGNISYLGDLAEELGEMVASSGEHIDRVQVTASTVKKASESVNRELQGVRRRRSRARKFKIVMTVIVFVVFAIFFAWILSYLGPVLSLFSGRRSDSS